MNYVNTQPVNAPHGALEKKMTVCKQKCLLHNALWLPCYFRHLLGKMDDSRTYTQTQNVEGHWIGLQEHISLEDILWFYLTGLSNPWVSFINFNLMLTTCLHCHWSLYFWVAGCEWEKIRKTVTHLELIQEILELKSNTIAKYRWAKHSRFSGSKNYFTCQGWSMWEKVVDVCFLQ